MVPPPVMIEQGSAVSSAVGRRRGSDGEIVVERPMRLDAMTAEHCMIRPHGLGSGELLVGHGPQVADKLDLVFCGVDLAAEQGHAGAVALRFRHEREGIVRVYRDDPWTERVEEFPCTCLASTGQDRWRIDAEHVSRFVDACSEGEVSDVMIELAVSECAADTNQSVWLVGTSSETARGLWPLPAGVADEPARDWMNSCLSISVDDAFVAREIQEVVDRYEHRAGRLKSSTAVLIDAAGAWTLLCGNS
jgi:hypothetical protein